MSRIDGHEADISTEFLLAFDTSLITNAPLPSFTLLDAHQRWLTVRFLLTLFGISTRQQTERHDCQSGTNRFVRHPVGISRASPAAGATQGCHACC
jgi:hypothetical protein